MNTYRRENNIFKYIGAAILFLVAITGFFTRLTTPAGVIGLPKLIDMMRASDYVDDLNFGLIDMSAITGVVEGMIRLLALLMILSGLIPLIEAILALVLRNSYLPLVLFMSIIVNLVLKGIFMAQISRINTLISETIMIPTGDLVQADPLHLGIWITLHLGLLILAIGAIVSGRRRESRRELFRERDTIIEGPM